MNIQFCGFYGSPHTHPAVPPGPSRSGCISKPCVSLPQWNGMSLLFSFFPPPHTQSNSKS